MRIAVVVALVAITATAGFVLGRITDANGGSGAPSDTPSKEVTLRTGDTARVPSVSLLCVTYVELEVAKMLCDRTGTDPRYEVIFERERTLIGRIGDPGDETVFPER
jgi:hypothetical protein